HRLPPLILPPPNSHFSPSPAWVCCDSALPHYLFFGFFLSCHNHTKMVYIKYMAINLELNT
ncbi:hypothetical protein HN51_047308, partial [Arachis hypogaea]